MSSGTGYAEIASHYRRLISDGTLAPGDPLPPMRQVCRDFDVTMTTANRAFQLLKSEGLTLAKPGSGTVVADRPRVATTAAARLDRIARTGKAYGSKETSVDHQVMVRSCGDPLVAELLDIEPHDEILLRRRTFLWDGVPSVVALSTIKLRAVIDVPELLRPERLDRFWQEIYTERTGRTVVRSPEQRGARLASQDELEAFGINVPPDVPVPVLVLVNVFHDDRGPIEVWEDVYAPGLWQVDIK